MAAPDYKFQRPDKTSWKRNPFVDNVGYLYNAWGRMIWAVFQWGNTKHETRNIKWSKKYP